MKHFLLSLRFDLKVGQKALAEYKQDPVTYSVAEMRAKYGL